jgi:hypothetical protein
MAMSTDHNDSEREGQEYRAAAPRSLLSLLCLLGACAQASDEVPEDGKVLAQASATTQVVNVPDPNGTYFAEVKANGTGCPSGTWLSSISPDGQTFTTTFSSYYAEVNASTKFAAKDCIITIRMHTPQGRSFSVQSLSYTGYAVLEPGVVGQQMANYYFQGLPAPVGDTNRTELRGPYDAPYLFQDDVQLASRVWSPCGVARDLIVMTRVLVQSATPGRFGYINLSALDGSGKLQLKLSSRTCSPGDPGSSSTPADSPSKPKPPPVGGTTQPPIGAVGGTTQPPISAVGGTTQPVRPPNSNLPSWAVPLLGQYAVRTDTYSISPIGPMLSDAQLALAEFVEVGDRLELRTQLCGKESSSLGLTTYLRTPDAWPETRHRVVLGRNNTWSTEERAWSVGYDRDGYAGCAGRRGARVPKRPEQTWIRGDTCVCGSTSSAPTLDDCRVTDPDRDGAPGIAFKYRGTPDADTWVAHTGMVSRTHYENGKVDPHGEHYASLDVDEYTYQLACEPSACNLPSISSPCTSEYNGSQFRRLPLHPATQAKWTCSDLRSSIASFFTPPLAPSRCTRDSYTREP